MPRKLKPIIDFHQQRFMQISESHCGPAVIQMLLSNQGFDVTQEDVAEAGGASTLIELNGMRVDQLALAVHRLTPQVTFFYKDHCTINELVRIVSDYRHPAGVEWQGVFGDEPGDETEDDDYGHYSLVIQAERRSRQLIIADPYKDYFSQARIFSFQEFDQRWFDYNEVTHPVTAEASLIKDDHLLFVIVQRNVFFPYRMGMKTFNFM
jgi:hypothetical protein